MSAIDKLPTNKNFLSPLGFAFSIYKTPGVNYFTQSVSVPTLNLGTAEVGTPFNRLKYPGGKMDFGSFNMTFRVDEELRNYMELYNWMTRISRNKGFEGYSAVNNAPVGEGVFSDATLLVLNSSKSAIVEVTFFNMFPTALSELNFDTRLTDVDYIDVIATFNYQTFDIKYI